MGAAGTWGGQGMGRRKEPPREGSGEVGSGQVRWGGDGRKGRGRRTLEAAL